MLQLCYFRSVKDTDRVVHTRKKNKSRFWEIMIAVEVTTELADFFLSCLQKQRLRWQHFYLRNSNVYITNFTSFSLHVTLPLIVLLSVHLVQVPSLVSKSHFSRGSSSETSSWVGVRVLSATWVHTIQISVEAVNGNANNSDFSQGLPVDLHISHPPLSTKKATS